MGFLSLGPMHFPARDVVTPPGWVPLVCVWGDLRVCI